MASKKIKKLVLKKETIARLSEQSMHEIKGGCANSTTCGNTTETIGWQSCVGCVTYDIDIYTIGHDDGPTCISKSDEWLCGLCYGQ